MITETVIGSSPSRTRYKIRTAVRESYVRCGADLLLNGTMTDLDAESQCPVCKNTISFRLRDRRVSELKPLTAILHAVELMDNGTICIVCEGSPLFDKEACLHTWLDSYQGSAGSIFRPQEFLDRMIRLRMKVPN